MRIPELRLIDLGAFRLAVWEWPGAGRPVILTHANGFHGRCWDAVIRHLPENQRCLAVELRGHGRSDTPPLPYSWRDFGTDLAQLLEVLDIRDALGVGHSLGGHATILAAALAPQAFAQLLLLDPVVLPRQAYTGAPLSGEHFAARRRARWESPEAMIERFQSRLPFSRWEPAVLEDYCRYGLVPAPDGNGYLLTCTPEVEAAIYLAAPTGNIYPEIATIQLPVLVARFGEWQSPDDWNMSASPTPPDLSAAFAHGQDLPIAGYTHFMPMEAPERIAALIHSIINSQSD